MTGLLPKFGNRRRTAAARISSPQLAGTTLANPARIHAWASCTGVAGQAASSASVPRTTIGTVCGTVCWVGVGAATARVMNLSARTTISNQRRANTTIQQNTDQTQLRLRKPTCQERPRHCNPTKSLRAVRMALGESNMVAARLNEAEREALTVYAARATWP